MNNGLRHFSISDFDCPCCGENNMDPAFLNMLDNARSRAGVWFVVNSGYRCPKHNAEVYGTKTSSHQIGVAADIKCTNSRDRFLMIEALIHVGFKRIKPAPRFIHVDFDLMKDQEVMWL